MLCAHASLAAPSVRRLAVWAIVLGALAVRLTAIHATVGFETPAVSEPAADSRIHMALVESLLAGRGYRIAGEPTASTPPLYVFFLAGLYRAFNDPAAVRFVQAVLGAAACAVMFHAGRGFFDERTGLVAAGILAVDPLAVYLAGLHLTENLFLVLLLLALVQSLRVADGPTLGRVIGLGGIVGLAALTRAVFLAFLPCVLVWSLAVWGPRNLQGYRVFGIAAVAAGLVILPWTARNWLALHAVVPIQSNAGLVFWAGNNPHADGGLVWPSARTWTAGPQPDDGQYGWRGLSVAADNARYMHSALAWIRQHPQEYGGLLVRKLVRLYGFTRGADRRDFPVPLPVVLFQGGLLTAAAAGLLVTVRRWRALAFMVMLIVFTNIATLAFSGGTRYTVPMLPSLILFAAAAVSTVATSAARAWGVAVRPAEVGQANG